MDQRLNELTDWVRVQLNVSSGDLEPVSGDASFRRYFRISVNGRSYVAMDAPPEKEDSVSFVSIAESWLAQDIPVPELIKVDLDQGFLLLSDFGNDLLLDYLKPLSPDEKAGDHYYHQAMLELCRIQNSKPPLSYVLPPYDAELLQREMALFPDWLLTKKLALTLSEESKNMLKQTFELLEASALAQSHVVVHRDYHARNLMVLGQPSDEDCQSDQSVLGIIDFQDAVIGPITYDLVSLLRDCYIVWPDTKVDEWCRVFYEMAGIESLGRSYQDFKRDFDWMGLQRHLKASGIFARLSIRDGKHGYLNDIPRTVQYLYSVSSKYDELSSFSDFLVEQVIPKLDALSLQTAGSEGVAV